jgi:hypothetical protein
MIPKRSFRRSARRQRGRRPCPGGPVLPQPRRHHRVQPVHPCVADPCRRARGGLRRRCRRARKATRAARPGNRNDNHGAPVPATMPRPGPPMRHAGQAQMPYRHGKCVHTGSQAWQQPALLPEASKCVHLSDGLEPDEARPARIIRELHRGDGAHAGDGRSAPGVRAGRSPWARPALAERSVAHVDKEEPVVRYAP